MLNCLIVDDEPLARKQLARYVEQVPYLQLAAEARNVTIARTILDTQPIDLILLDINMPGITGVDFLKQNVINQQVIFITAYSEYALEGFELEATDYLVKPVTFERFLKAVEKVKLRISGSENLRIDNYRKEYLFVKHKQSFERIAISEILFIEAMLNYIHVVTNSGKYTIYAGLKQAEMVLPKQLFFRVHKSYIVAIPKISAIQSTMLIINDEEIPISRKHKAELAQAVARFHIPL